MTETGSDSLLRKIGWTFLLGLALLVWGVWFVIHYAITALGLIPIIGGILALPVLVIAALVYPLMMYAGYMLDYAKGMNVTLDGDEVMIDYKPPVLAFRTPKSPSRFAWSDVQSMKRIVSRPLHPCQIRLRNGEVIRQNLSVDWSQLIAEGTRRGIFDPQADPSPA